MENQPSNAAGLYFGAEATFDLKAFLFKFIRYWYLFILFLILAFSVAYLYLRYTIPEYSIKTTLLVKDEDSGLDASEEMAFADLGVFKSKKNINNEIQILKSRTLMTQVVKELGIDVTYSANGRIKDRELYEDCSFKVKADFLKESAYGEPYPFVLRGNQFTLTDHDNKKYVGFLNQAVKLPFGVITVVLCDSITQRFSPSEEILVSFHKIENVATQYSTALVVKPIREASILELSLNDAVPKKGEDLLNKLVEVYNRTGIEDKNRVSANTVKFIEDRLKFVNQELSSVEQGLEAFKRNNDITDLSSEASMVLGQLSEYDKELAEKDVQLDILKAIEEYLTTKGKDFALAPAATGLQDATLLAFLSEHNRLILERERLLKTAKEENPAVQVINIQLQKLRANINESIQNQRKSVLLARNSLKTKNLAIESRIKSVPRKERQYLEIQRQQNIKQSLLLYLLQKREETELSLAVTVPNSRVVDSAISTPAPIKPNRNIILLSALIAGLLIPIVIVITKELLDDSIRSRKDIEDNTSVPVIGGISHSDTTQKIVVTRGSRKAIAEMFRMVRTNIDFLAASKTQKTLLVTSSMSGEGKSFLAINIAISLALSGKKTIMLEMDLRKPKLIKYLEEPVGKLGLTNYLVGDIPFDSIITPTKTDANLFFISSGPIPPNPTELMMNEKLDRLIAYLKTSYDYIVIDTSPVGLVTDAVLLNRFADAALYVVRHNVTRKGQLSIIEELSVQQKLNSPAIIYNDIKGSGSYGYGYGYGYGSGYGYGYGYYDDDPKLSFGKKVLRFFKRKK